MRRRGWAAAAGCCIAGAALAAPAGAPREPPAGEPCGLIHWQVTPAPREERGGAGPAEAAAAEELASMGRVAGRIAAGLALPPREHGLVGLGSALLASAQTTHPLRVDVWSWPSSDEGAGRGAVVELRWSVEDEAAKGALAAALEKTGGWRIAAGPGTLRARLGGPAPATGGGAEGGAAGGADAAAARAEALAAALAAAPALDGSSEFLRLWVDVDALRRGSMETFLEAPEGLFLQAAGLGNARAAGVVVRQAPAAMVRVLGPQPAGRPLAWTGPAVGVVDVVWSSRAEPAGQFRTARLSGTEYPGGEVPMPAPGAAMVLVVAADFAAPTIRGRTTGGWAEWIRRGVAMAAAAQGGAEGRRWGDGLAAWLRGRQEPARALAGLVGRRGSLAIPQGEGPLVLMAGLRSGTSPERAMQVWRTAIEGGAGPAPSGGAWRWPAQGEADGATVAAVGATWRRGGLLIVGVGPAAEAAAAAEAARVGKSADPATQPR